MSGRGGGSWDSLTEEITEQVSAQLPPNEVALSLRSLNKQTANHLRRWTRVQLSQSVPPHAFVKQFADENSTRDIGLKQRQQLVCLVARSGNVANLKVALAAVGCPPTEDAFQAAAAGGHVEMCGALLELGCPHELFKLARAAAAAGQAAVVRWVLQLVTDDMADGDKAKADKGDEEDDDGDSEEDEEEDYDERARILVISLSAAAGGGHKALCEELMTDFGVKVDEKAVREAAEGGHEELTIWLLEKLLAQATGDDDGGKVEIDDGMLLERAAYGMSLPALQRLWHYRLGRVEEGSDEDDEVSECTRVEDLVEASGADLAVAALLGATPDWAAKLEWLEGPEVNASLGEEAPDLQAMAYDAWPSPVTLPGAVERLEVLRQRGLLVEEVASAVAVDSVLHSSLAVLRYMRAQGLFELQLLEGGSLMRDAAAKGDLQMLEELLAMTAAAAAEEGGKVEQGPLADPGLAEAAASSGSLELVRWLWEREGCRAALRGARVFDAAARSGNGALLEWLVTVASCAMPGGTPYLAAARNSDLATLRRLRALGCPFALPAASAAAATKTDKIEEDDDDDGDDDDDDDDEDNNGNNDSENISTFGRAVFEERWSQCSLAVLRCLAAEGCPVDWEEAQARAELRVRAKEDGDDGEADEVLAWVQSRGAGAGASGSNGTVQAEE